MLFINNKQKIKYLYLMQEIIKHQSSPNNSRKITPSSPVREIIYHRPRNLSRILEHYVEDFIADDDKCVACKQPANNLLVSCESDTIHIYPCCCPQHKAHINKI